MANVIHGQSHKAIKHLRKNPAALALIWIYGSRANYENVAWPSIRCLVEDTGWSYNVVRKARRWLVEHGALEPVHDYVRPQWRDLDPDTLRLRLLLDKAEYYRLTGKLVLDGQTYHLFYNAIDQEDRNPHAPADDALDDPSDDSRRDPSDGSVDGSPGDPSDGSPDDLSIDHSSDGSPGDHERNTKRSERNTRSIADPPRGGRREARRTTDKPAEDRVAEDRPSKRTRTPASVINPIKERIAERFGISWDTSPENELGMVRKAAKQLADSGTTVEEVDVIYDYCVRNFDGRFTPIALTKHKTKALAERVQSTNGHSRPDLSPADIRRIEEEHARERERVYQERMKQMDALLATQNGPEGNSARCQSRRLTDAHKRSQTPNS